MADVVSMHHGGDVRDELPRHPPTILGDCDQFATSIKRRQHSKSLTVYQLVNTSLNLKF